MAGGGQQQQKKKGGNKHARLDRTHRKYGVTRHNPAKAGKRKRYCEKYPNCIHRGKVA